MCLHHFLSLQQSALTPHHAHRSLIRSNQAQKTYQIRITSSSRCPFRMWPQFLSYFPILGCTGRSCTGNTPWIWFHCSEESSPKSCLHLDFPCSSGHCKVCSCSTNLLHSHSRQNHHHRKCVVHQFHQRMHFSNENQTLIWSSERRNSLNQLANFRPKSWVHL